MSRITDGDAYDLIVVGGGSAGCAMAARLSEREDLSVLLLEAGRSDKHPFTRVPAANVNAVLNPEFDWCFPVEPDASIGGRADTWPAAKVLGGGSAINGMMFIRGHRHDYDSWHDLGATGWNYQSVLPYFRRMETNERGADAYRGGEGPLSVSEGRARYPLTDAWIEAAVQAGVPRSPDLNGGLAEGVDFVQVSQRKGMRHSTAVAYIWPNLNRASLTLQLHSRVNRIIVENRRATGVEITGEDGTIRRISARRGVVVCAGTMNSPRLLMLSGIGEAAQLKASGIEVVHDLPGVGQNLQDHPGTHLVNEAEGRTLNAEVQGLRGLGHLASFLTARKGALTTSIGHAQAFVRTNGAMAVPNIQLIFAPLAFDYGEDGKIRLRKSPSVSTAVALMRPRSRGRITLAGPDPALPPLIRHELLGDPQDVDEMVDGIEFARRIMEQPAIAGAITGEVRPALAPEHQTADRTAMRDYVRGAVSSFYHQIGTCKMGSDAMAVVDPELKVRGLEGLWVADASVMPAMPSGNTNATAIMIGEKGSDHVLRAIGNRPSASLNQEQGHP
ncbi:GMC family oxidoreductase [Aurantiacibacter xanthus]|uniref:GMC family oxidoreductase n=1 Tax=Aurantiacibacter xanthus TaxID=1784712 RepID=UPI001FEAD432|nr:GMC family oxidoreductase N-terminal domain-containing protein [Aurantiacibacter xanthus]